MSKFCRLKKFFAPKGKKYCKKRNTVILQAFLDITRVGASLYLLHVSAFPTVRMNEKYDSHCVSAVIRGIRSDQITRICTFICANVFSSMSAKIFDLAVESEIFHIFESHHPLSVLRVRCLARLMHNALSEGAKRKTFLYVE